LSTDNIRCLNINVFACLYGYIPLYGTNCTFGLGGFDSIQGIFLHFRSDGEPKSISQQTGFFFLPHSFFRFIVLYGSNRYIVFCLEVNILCPNHTASLYSEILSGLQVDPITRYSASYMRCLIEAILCRNGHCRKAATMSFVFVGFINALVHFSGCQVDIPSGLYLYGLVTFNSSCFGIDIQPRFQVNRTACLNRCSDIHRLAVCPVIILIPDKFVILAFCHRGQIDVFPCYNVCRSICSCIFNFGSRKINILPSIYY